MFASQDYLERNLETFIYDKEVAQGINLSGNRLNRKAVVYSLNSLATLKATSAYKLIFDMQDENNFVAQDNYVLVTPAQQALLELVATKTKARELYIYLFEILMLSTYQVDKDLINQEAACGVLLLLRALRALQAPSPLSLSNNSKNATS